MKCGVITFPGSNCDLDLVHVLGNLLGQEVLQLWHKDNNLKQVDVLFLPGGFSYGDYLRSGALARFSPIMQAVQEFAASGRVLVGICNGFQILTEAQLLPGALLRNRDMHFICDTVNITPVNRHSHLTRGLAEQPYQIPIAHAEGNYFCSADTLKQLQDNDQILFRYTDRRGLALPEANPNGSLDNIAGVCNAKGNVLGLMPHPERAADPLLGNTDGLALFNALFNRASA